MQFQRFGVTILAAAMASSSQGQTTAPQVTPEQIAAQVRQLCAYKPAQDSYNIDYMRKKMAVSDRMETRRVETEMARHASIADRCLTDVSARIDEQVKTAPPQTIAAYRAAVEQLRKSSMADIRAAYASYGFRPSSAAPGPRFGYCRIHDNFDPPTYIMSRASSRIATRRPRWRTATSIRPKPRPARAPSPPWRSGSR